MHTNCTALDCPIPALARIDVRADNGSRTRGGELCEGHLTEAVKAEVKRAPLIIVKALAAVR